MISQRCPVCESSRIRKGYRPTSFWSRLVLRYNLLCDNCNWEFIGFALPGFISTKQTKSSKERKEKSNLVENGNSQLRQSEMSSNSGTELIEKPASRIKKKIKIRI
jgi:hypothetical protein